MGEFHMNVFRILGDVSHTISKLILIWAIHSNRSAEGVSLITQVLYIAIFLTRYLDLFWMPVFKSWLNAYIFTMKILYILTSLYTVFLMMRVYARTREREKAWRLGIYCLAGSAIAAMPVNAIFQGKHDFAFESFWTFSIILESVCVLPQLLLLRQTTVPTVIDSYYLVTLGSYRAFYILNWMVRGFGSEHHFDPISTIFGIVQTALYIDFAWVYWTRQRVKLRGGGVVDSDDLSRGWLVGRLVGNKHVDFEEEEGVDEGRQVDGNGAARQKPRNARSWGVRGVSVSADDGVRDLEAGRKVPQRLEEQPLADPQAFEDDDESDHEHEQRQGQGQSTVNRRLSGSSSVVSNGAEWREDHGK